MEEARQLRRRDEDGRLVLKPGKGRSLGARPPLPLAELQAGEARGREVVSEDGAQATRSAQQPLGLGPAEDEAAVKLERRLQHPALQQLLEAHLEAGHARSTQE